jgi:acetolactate synthase I/II/III large subunit
MESTRTDLTNEVDFSVENEKLPAPTRRSFADIGDFFNDSESLTPSLNSVFFALETENSIIPDHGRLPYISGILKSGGAGFIDGTLPDAIPIAPLRAMGTLPHRVLDEVVIAALEQDSELSNGVPEPVETTLVAPQPSASEQLIASLVAAGVDTFFGIPGGPVSPVFDAVLRDPRARLIQSRHETSAVFAAVGYHRASGKIPAVVVTAGPGVTNAVTGIASAYLERVPMVVICGDVAWAASGGKLLQDSGPEGLDIEHMLGSITRATIRVAQARSAASQAIAALQAAADPYQPGPALLVVPIHRAGSGAGHTRIEGGAPRSLVAPPRMEVVEETCRMLALARRPLLVLGAGCRRHSAALTSLIDAMEIPFVTTPQAKGVVSETHPRSLRNGGLAASQWAREYTAAGVDVALVLGTDLDDCSIGPTPYIQKGGRLVHVDLDPTVFNRNLPAEIAVVADLGEFVVRMTEVALARGLRNRGCDALLRQIRAKSPFAEPDFQDDDAPVITPHRAIADLQRAAPEATFITDIGEHMLFALHYLTADGPDRFSIGLSLGSMGSGITAAVGMGVADPTRPVICICGDGGMQMAGMETLVALHERLPIIYAVFNDARYNMVYHGFEQVFGYHAPWESPWVDFASWGRAMGLQGVRIDHPGQIDASLIAHLVDERVPVILDIRIDREVSMKGSGRNEALQHMSMLHDE